MGARCTLVRLLRELLWWLRIVLWLVAGAFGFWAGLWALLILNSYVPVVLLFVVAVVALGLIESRRQDRATKRSEDVVENIETFLRWERVQLLMERLREMRARERLEELRRRSRH